MTSDNKESTGDKSVAQPAIVVDFRRIEWAVVCSTASLEDFQVAFRNTDDNPFRDEDFCLAIEELEARLDELSTAIGTAQTTLKDFKPDTQPSPGTRTGKVEEGQKAYTKWCAGLARFDQTSSPLLKRILIVPGNYGDFPPSMAAELETVTTEYQPHLVELKAEIEAARGYVESFQV